MTANGKKAVPEPAGSGMESPVAPPRGMRAHTFFALSTLGGATGERCP